MESMNAKFYQIRKGDSFMEDLIDAVNEITINNTQYGKSLLNLFTAVAVNKFSKNHDYVAQVDGIKVELINSVSGYSYIVLYE